MNRLQSWLLDGEASDVFTAVAPSADSRPSQASTPHATFLPLHYEPNYAYPLLVWLHGPDDDETQLRQIMPRVSLRNYVAVGPRGTAVGVSDHGFRWCQSKHHIHTAEQRVLESIDAVSSRLRIAPDRVFLGGYDCGGTMALRIGLQNPKRFAGVLSLGGEFPSGGTPLARLDQIRRLPLFVACAGDCPRYPTTTACEDLRLLHSAGISSIALRLYPGDVAICTRMLADMDRWIMEQISGSASVELSDSGHQLRAN